MDFKFLSSSHVPENILEEVQDLASMFTRFIQLFLMSNSNAAMACNVALNALIVALASSMDRFIANPISPEELDLIVDSISSLLKENFKSMRQNETGD